MKTNKIVPEEGKVTLCAVNNCCPTVDFTKLKSVIIRDDYGGKVKLTREQWQDLKNKFVTQPKKAN
jgi:hypothetical protein